MFPPLSNRCNDCRDAQAGVRAAPMAARPGNPTTPRAREAWLLPGTFFSPANARQRARSDEGSRTRELDDRAAPVASAH